MGIIQTIVHNNSRQKVLVQRESEAFPGTLDLLCEDINRKTIVRYWAYDIRNDKYLEIKSFGKCDKYQKRTIIQDFIYK